MVKVRIKIKKDREFVYLADIVRRGFGNKDLEIISTLSKEKATIFNKYTKEDGVFLEDAKRLCRELNILKEEK